MSALPLVIPPDHRILYFDRDRFQFGCFSHFHPSPIEIDGERWPTVEHYYQAQRSDDPAYRQAVRDARTPGRAKHLAEAPDRPRKYSKQSWFRRNHAFPRSDWADVKLDIMRRADRAKFMQNPELGALLLDTGDAELIEDSPFDAYWGFGKQGNGLNWAGWVLMEIREEFRATPPWF